MAAKDKDVQGVAIYLEFRKTNQTIQLFLTPDGFTEDNKIVQSAFFRRQLSSHEPKKRWKMFSLYGGEATNENLRALQNDGPLPIAVSIDGVHLDISNRANSLYEYMKSLVRGGYKLVKQPIYLELSKEDYTAIYKRDTPVKVVNRMKAARAALDFPTEIVNSPASV